MLVEYTNESFGLNISLNNAEDNFVIRVNGFNLLIIPLEFAEALSQLPHDTLRRMFAYYISKCDFVKLGVNVMTEQALIVNVITKCLNVAFTTYLG